MIRYFIIFYTATGKDGYDLFGNFSCKWNILPPRIQLELYITEVMGFTEPVISDIKEVARLDFVSWNNDTPFPTIPFTV